MRDDIREILIGQYAHCVNWQKKNGIQVEMTVDEFISLWSAARIRTLENKLAKSPRVLEAYLDNPHFKPVCSWRSREDRLTGVMTVENARIMRADDSRKLFQFKKGDTHSPKSIEKMRQPKSQATKDKMRAKRLAYWAAKRGEAAPLYNPPLCQMDK